MKGPVGSSKVGQLSRRPCPEMFSAARANLRALGRRLFLELAECLVGLSHALIPSNQQQ